ncbi:hypothetical protein [Pseudomonas phage phiZ98]|nr:hypothetical protein [Pseudomonas phage phiZ98]
MKPIYIASPPLSGGSVSQLRQLEVRSTLLIEHVRVSPTRRFARCDRKNDAIRHVVQSRLSGIEAQLRATKCFGHH